MIRKLRLKFVAVCMLMIVIVLAGLFLAAYTVARNSIQRNSQAVLNRVITEDNRFSDDQETLFGGNQVKLPYFTVELWGSQNTAYVTGGTYANLQDTEELAQILSECLAQDQTEGTIARYNLRYLRMETPLYERIAFVDISAEEAAINNLVTAFLQVAFVTLAVLLVLSILLARWATRPVERAWQQQHRFLADASHELKTPLTVILSNAELMRSVPLDPRLERWTDNIHSEAAQMKTLVEEMLTLARADDMGPAAPFEAVSLSDLATDCALLFEPVAFEAGKTLEDAIAPDITVSGNPNRLKQLISVLLDNAVKYGREGTAIVLSLEKSERSARLQVSNQGEPIPPEQMSRLFERFYRADASRGEKKGFGLGLSIASAIAQEHKGTLRAESDETSTRFIFTLPLKK
jgi:two-component system sensor histidine kinase CiaH